MRVNLSRAQAGLEIASPDLFWRLRRYRPVATASGLTQIAVASFETVICITPPMNGFSCRRVYRA
jgi:hypothetical protein